MTAPLPPGSRPWLPWGLAQAERFAELRQRLGITAAEYPALAARVGVSMETAQRWRSGIARRIQVAHLERLAAQLAPGLGMEEAEVVEWLANGRKP